MLVNTDNMLHSSANSLLVYNSRTSYKTFRIVLLTNLLFSSVQSADGSLMCTMVLNDYQIHIQWYLCAVVILDISSLSEP